MRGQNERADGVVIALAQITKKGGAAATPPNDTMSDSVLIKKPFWP